MVRFHTPGGALVLFPIPRSPLLKPSWRRVHGASWLDCVTEWFLWGVAMSEMRWIETRYTRLPMKLKVTMSPSTAVTVWGLKKRPLSPTLTFGGQ